MFEVGDTVRDLVTNELVTIESIHEKYKYYTFELSNGQLTCREFSEVDFATARH